MPRAEEVLAALRPLEHVLLAEPCADRSHASAADPENPRRTIVEGRGSAAGRGDD